MRTRVKNTVVNQELKTRIVKLQNLYESALSADNIGLMESKYISDIGNYLDQFKLQDLSAINNVDMGDLNSYIRFLQASDIEQMAIPIKGTVIATPDATTDTEQTELVFDIPKGWDGRNGYVFYNLFGKV